MVTTASTGHQVGLIRQDKEGARFNPYASHGSSNGHAQLVSAATKV
jgi:hypothetical protein